MKTLHQQKHQPSIFFRSDNLDFIPHLHSAVELTVLTRGHTDVLCDGRRHRMAQGDLFLAFPNRVHGYENSQNCRAIVFIIPSAPSLSPVWSTLEQSIPDRPLLARGSWEHTGVNRLLDMALAESQASPTMLQGYALLVISKLLPLLELRPADRNDSVSALQALMQYVNTHYAQPMTRAELAQATGYNESYISHLFREHLHTTLTDYLASLRVNDAQNLLTRTDLSVSRIALSLGFGTIRSFNRVFLDRTGMAPAAYRAANRNK